MRKDPATRKAAYVAKRLHPGPIETHDWDEDGSVWTPGHIEKTAFVKAMVSNYEKQTGEEWWEDDDDHPVGDERWVLTKARQVQHLHMIETKEGFMLVAADAKVLPITLWLA